ncbi:MAG: bifunctional phosphopantothenoylcysteine decarboxylase/phosphopantothenate--cysteine ligase CoaBC [Ruminococcus sp.]|nr:bifunctional phosphopantothenoylcysteine decarboxylase/phosphopantothenate--cysteine ligase CoaBC [Ruminococcus sp.]
MLNGKTILLAITGSIAAYKAANIVRMLKKLHCNVHVLMTQNATNFIHPLTLETLSQNKCLIDTFDRNFQYSVEHVALAKQADLVLVAPASANIIGKLANGLADDMVTTTIMACPCKKIISPAMNHNMFHNTIVQENVKKLQSHGYEIIPPSSGMLANGDIGDGRMPEESLIIEYVLKEIAFNKDLTGKKVLVTAGATMESIDPVRYITNHSTGKMGIAIARAAMQRGANVYLIAAHISVTPPPFINLILVKSALEMFEVVKKEAVNADIIIKAAAVADYRPINISSQKIKKSDDNMSIQLERTTDILAYLGKNKKPNQILCGFSMETENLLKNSKKKLEKKNLDLIAANLLSQEGAGFAGDTNVLTLITKENTTPLEKMSKDSAAHILLDTILKLSK